MPHCVQMGQLSPLSQPYPVCCVGVLYIRSNSEVCTQSRFPIAELGGAGEDSGAIWFGCFSFLFSFFFYLHWPLAISSKRRENTDQNQTNAQDATRKGKNRAKLKGNKYINDLLSLGLLLAPFVSLCPPSGSDLSATSLFCFTSPFHTPISTPV